MAGGWPDDWEARKAGRDCEGCAALGSHGDEHGIRIARLPFTEVRLARRSRLPGYCIVSWCAGHVVEAHELAPDDAAGYWNDVMRVARVLEELFQPVKMNLLTLGNGVPHLHTHVVPRYADDPAPGGPLTWDQLVGDEERPADELARQAAAIGDALR